MIVIFSYTRSLEKYVGNGSAAMRTSKRSAGVAL